MSRDTTLATVGNPPDFMNALKTTARKRNSLYDPAYEHDSCGVGLVAHIKGVPSRAIVDDAYAVLKSMEHRAGVGAQPNSGDGAGMLTALPYNLSLIHI